MKRVFCILSLFAVLLLWGCSEDKPVHVRSVELSATSLSLTIGESVELRATIIPENSIETSVTWSVADAAVASVENGRVTALALGTTTVTASVGEISAMCVVTVNPVAVSGIALNVEECELELGQTFQLTATLRPDNATDKSVEWSSTDSGVALVDAEGVVTAVGLGEAVITCRAGEVSATCQIAVKNSERPEVGDFYYSDGTWSEFYLASKEPIGVVFWLGDPTENDASLRADHPECNHGLVVALHQGLSAWQSNFDALPGRLSDWVMTNAPEEMTPILTRNTSSINTICGYGFTRAIEKFNAAPENADMKVEAVEYVVDYRERVEAPQQSSGWYLPSPRELSLICSGDMAKNIFDNDGGNAMMLSLNERIELLRTYNSGFNRLPKQGHWSCAEIDDEGDAPREGRMLTYSVWFDEGDVTISFKDANNLYTRPVLAF